MALVTAFERRKVRFSDTVTEIDDVERRGGNDDPAVSSLTEALTGRLYSLDSVEEEYSDPIEVAPSTSNLNACTVNLAKAIVGVGITAFPKAFALLGVGPAVLALFCTATLTFLSCVGLSRASQRSGRFTYPELVQAEFGRCGSRVLQLCLILNCGGMLMTYLMVLDNLVASAHREISWHYPNPVSDFLGSGGVTSVVGGLTGDDLLLGVVVLLLILPLVSFRRLNSVAFSSAIGMTALLFWSAALIAGVIAAIHNGTAQKLHWLPSAESWQGSYVDLLARSTAVLPVMLCAYICHFSFHPVMMDLQPYSQASVRQVLIQALGLCSLVYCLISLGSLTLLGENVNDNVLLDFTYSSLLPVVGRKLANVAYITVHVSYFVSLLACFPLQMWPCRDSIWRLLMGDRAFVGVGYYVTTYSCLAAAYLGAVLLPSIWIVLQLIGATAGAMIAFIFPGLLMVHNSYAMWPFLPSSFDGSPSWKRWEGGCGWLLVVLGTVVGFAGVANAMGLFANRF